MSSPDPLRLAHTARTVEKHVHEPPPPPYRLRRPDRLGGSRRAHHHDRVIAWLTWLAVWHVLIVADAATTLYGLSHGAVEGNPVAAAILNVAGPVPMVALGVVACCVLAVAPLLRWRAPYGRVVWVACAVLLAGKLAVVVLNLVVLANA